METKKYKTAAAMRRAMEDQLATERKILASYQEDILMSQARIEVILGLLKTTEANGKEEGEDA